MGSIVFFSVVVAPGIFRHLGRSQAGDLLSHLFPDYYLVGTLCGGAALAVLVLLFLFDSGSRALRFFQLGLVALMLAANLYAGSVLEARIHRLREERVTGVGKTVREEAGRSFARLHRRSVTLNLAVLGLGGVALATTAMRRRIPS